MTDGGWSDAEEKAILGWYFNSDAKTPESSLWVALCTGALLDDGSNIADVETTYPGYARQEVLSSGGAWVLGAGDDPSKYANSALIQFPICTGASGQTITHFGLMRTVSGQTAGDLMFSGSLTLTQIVDLDVQPQFDVAALEVRLGS